MYIGVDVGTGSARACLMDEKGEIVALASKEIHRWEPKASHINQSASDIWDAICTCTKKIMSDSKVEPEKVKGIAFDATCSLVVVDKNMNPIAVGPDWDNASQNVILWMDHRAPEETTLIAATKHPLLRYLGGKMSIEMEIPKALWLKNNMDRKTFEKCYFFDLPDYLTCRASGATARSFNSTVCKQGYVPKGVDNSRDGWSKEFLTEIGLGDLTENNYERLGGIDGINGTYFSAGEKVGQLSEKSATELGLHTNVVVGSGVIDAYSGWIGTVAAKTDRELPDRDIENRLAAVAGTSTCHIVLSQVPVFVPGVWGPYKDVLISGMWAAEGGQSATGELLSFVLKTHPAKPALDELCAKTGKSSFDVLNGILENLVREHKVPSSVYLTKHFFLYGDLHGNRSPIADPEMRGSITGVGMDTSLENLATTYLATVEFICQQTRQIIDKMNECGHDIKAIYLSGGQCRNNVLTQLMADCTGMPIVIPRYIDAAVVFGTAILAAAAANTEPLWDAMGKYSGPGSVVFPQVNEALKRLLDAKFKVFLDQAERQVFYREQVDNAIGN